jgi:Coenzyme PQQ synthesis protein D (PqqD)
VGRISFDSQLHCAPDVLSRNLDGDTVLLDLESGTYFGLDAVGTRIWELVGQNQPLSTILEIILDEYDVDEQRARTDLLELLDALMAKGLIRATEAS